MKQVEEILDEAVKTKTVKWMYFEGGEPFLCYPIILAGVRLLRKRALKIGVATNSYWAPAIVDATVWLQPLKELHLGALSISDDAFHHQDRPDTRAKNVMVAAEKLGLPADAIRIEPLAKIISTYDLHRHPICSPLLGAGPAALAKAHGRLHAQK